MNSIRKFAALGLALLFACVLGLTGCKKDSDNAASQAAAKPKFTVAVSIYAGWMPWYLANEDGSLKKWANRYNMDINVVYMDYPASLDAFVAGKVDAVVMTNMEALDMPAAAGIETSAIIMGDYSNGNDAVLVRDNLTLEGLKGKNVFLVEKTVSQYMLSRALSMQTKLGEKDITIMNVSDADIAPSFIASSSQKAVVTWAPMTLEIEKDKGVRRIFDSSKIPGEIMDLMVVNTKVLNGNPDLGRALTGVWYEKMEEIRTAGPAREAAVAKMASLAKNTPAEFEAQLATTALYTTSRAAADYTASKEVQAKMDLVRHFCFDHSLLGEGAKSVDVVGISYPDGTVQGDRNNVKLHFDARFMEEHAAGKITLK